MKALIALVTVLFLTSGFGQSYDNLVAEGKVFLSQRKYEEAISKFKEAEKIDMKRIDAKYGIAVALSQKSWISKNKEDLNRSLEALREIEKMDDKFANLNYNFSIAYYELGEYDKALKHIDKQIEFGNQKDGDLYYQKGLVQIKLKQDKDACKNFKKATKLGAGNAENALNIHCK